MPEVVGDELLIDEPTPVEEVALIEPAAIEPPPPPKEDDGRRHKKEAHARRDRSDNDEPRRQGKISGKRDEKRAKLVVTDDQRVPKMRGKRKAWKGRRRALIA